jgi:hypothetical protein
MYSRIGKLIRPRAAPTAAANSAPDNRETTALASAGRADSSSLNNRARATERSAETIAPPTFMTTTSHHRFGFSRDAPP